ncbi:MAG: TolC family protein [Cyanobacteria bacterium P01_H01_bin.74]
MAVVTFPGSAKGQGTGQNDSKKLTKSATTALQPTQKQTLKTTENNALLNRSQSLALDQSVLDNISKDKKTLSLKKLVSQLSARSILLKQSETAVKDAKKNLKKLNDPNPLNLLKLSEIHHYKKAAQYRIESAYQNEQWAAQTVAYQAILLYEGLSAAHEAKRVALNRLNYAVQNQNSTQSQFDVGKVTRLDVTQAKIQALEAYKQYLKATEVYFEACIAIQTQLDKEDRVTYLPENDADTALAFLKTLPPQKDPSSENKEANRKKKASAEASKKNVPRIIFDPAHGIFNPDYSFDDAMDQLKKRPDYLAEQLGVKAYKALSKTGSGIEKQKRIADWHQFELTVRQGFNDKKKALFKQLNAAVLAEERLQIAKSQFDLATDLQNDLETSYYAGFSSQNQWQAGQLRLMTAKTQYHQQLFNQQLTQLKLLYHLGLLYQYDLQDAESADEPQPANTL